MSAARSGTTRFPLAALLRTYSARPVECLPGAADIAAAPTAWLNESFLDTASPDDLAAAVEAFAAAAGTACWHPDAVRRGRSLLRHAVGHLVRGMDPLPEKLSRCLRPGGAYFVAGLGAGFWAAVVQATDPATLPRWLPEVEAGARRVGLVASSVPFGSDAAFAALVRAYRTLTTEAGLSAPALDAFFVRVARTRGRELDAGPLAPTDPIPNAVRELRTRTPLRRRLGDHAPPPAGPEARSPADVYADVQPRLGTVAATAAAGRLPGSGVVPLTADALAGLAAIDDAFVPGLAPADEYPLLREVVAALRDRYRVHPLEVPDLLASLRPAPAAPPPPGFRGFCSDTFQFLGELEANNTRAWMDAERDRYQFAVREPLVELCEAVAARYVRPVLGGEYGWDLQCDPRPGRAVTSICKNDYGRSSPYTTAVWLTFYPTAAAGRQQAPQLFVRADPHGVEVGFHLGRTARDAGRRFRAAVREHAAILFDALEATTAVEAVRFGDGVVRSAADLRAWAGAKTLFASRRLPVDTPSLRTEELVGEVVLTFDRLVPLFAAAVEADPLPVLARRAGRPPGTPRFDRDAFLRETFLPETWLDRATGLLGLRKQLVLQGPSGTGKTFVARHLARFLAKDRPDAVRFVQFHPAYGYAEFVEQTHGDGVKDGLLIDFAAAAARRPADPFVLVIDDMPRGNLPAVFGELLYLLEYRGQSVTLPFSRRVFRLPDNVYLIGTANTADPAAGLLATPLRRRFAFVDMPPDAGVLARWFAARPPLDPSLGPAVQRLFEQLNARVRRDLGPDRQIGHGSFMLADLDADKLRAVWDHHVRPMLGPDAPPDLDRWLS